jgi:hypothetical protein
MVRGLSAASSSSPSFKRLMLLNIFLVAGLDSGILALSGLTVGISAPEAGEGGDEWRITLYGICYQLLSLASHAFLPEIDHNTHRIKTPVFTCLLAFNCFFRSRDNLTELQPVCTDPGDTNINPYHFCCGWISN